MMKTIVFIIMLACYGMTMAQGLTGSWSGKLAVGPQQFRVALNINNDGCTLDSPDQGVKGIMCETVYLSEDSINVSIPLIGGSYTAKLVNDKLVGTFTQMGYAIPINLEKKEIKIIRPQTPIPPFNYDTAEVTFGNDAAGAVLAGTLTTPKNYDKATTPVVLLVTGSGLQNRDEEIYNHRPFAVIADHLARHGIATLRYDDRSVGKSTGNATNATTADFCDDAAAGIAYLRNLDKFAKVGVLGHSEGGQIALILASKGSVDFAVSLAAPAMRGDSLLVEQNRLLLIHTGISGTYVQGYTDALMEVFAHRISSKASAANAREIVNGIVAKQKGVKLPSAMVENLVTIMGTPDKWLDYNLAYNPRNDIATAKCPVMAIGGSKDLQVPQRNVEIIGSLLPDNKGNMTKVYYGLNHMFQNCRTGNTSEYSQISETISTEVLQDITTWIKQQ